MIGCSNVGGGVVNAFFDHRFNPSDVVLRAVAVKDLSKIRDDVHFPKATRLTDNPYSLIDDRKIDIIVEVMGGDTDAYTYTLEGFYAHKHWVTANKKLLGKHFPDIIEAANRNGVSLSFEASVCGAVPVIRTLTEYLKHQTVMGLRGIVNGTTNHILTQMEGGVDFASALKEAQNLGIAESDPTDDIEGFDARSKLAILGSIAAKKHIEPESIPCTGIANITSEEIAAARDNNCAIKLLASAQKIDGTWVVQVAPTLVHRDDPLASVPGKLNSITIDGDLSGPLTLTGYGASRNPTAGAVIADIAHAIEHVRFGIPDSLPNLNNRSLVTASLT